MELTIYIDVLWLRTFMSELLTSIFVNIWMRQAQTVWRILWMSALMAGAETLWFVIIGYGGLYVIGSSALRLVLIWWLFRPRKTGVYVRLVLWSLFATLVLGGVLNICQTKLSENMWFPVGVFCCAGVVMIALILEEHRIRNDAQLYPLTLYQGACRVEVLALWDTGNRLIDPYVQEPVHLLSRTKLEHLELQDEKSRLIPYVSLGSKNGLLQVWNIDKMEYGGEVYAPVVVGAAEDTLFEGKDYQMILSVDWKKK